MWNHYSIILPEIKQILNHCNFKDNDFQAMSERSLEELNLFYLYDTIYLFIYISTIDWDIEVNRKMISIV